MVIVDTTVWIDYLQGVSNPETDWLEAELDHQRLGLTDVILCEVLQGVRHEAAAATVERQLLKLEVFETGGIDLARATAKNYRALRSRGHTVPKTIDCLIATFCYASSIRCFTVTETSTRSKGSSICQSFILDSSTAYRTAARVMRGGASVPKAILRGSFWTHG